MQELLELSNETMPFPKTKPIARKLHHGIQYFMYFKNYCLITVTNILGFLHLNSKNICILLWVMTFQRLSLTWNFFFYSCLCLHSWKNKYKTSVISAACVIENSPSGLGFPLTRYLDILEILLLLLLGYCQENAVCPLGEYFTQSGCQMLKRRESYKFTEHSLMPVWGLLADKSQFAWWNSVWDFISFNSLPGRRWLGGEDLWLSSPSIHWRALRGWGEDDGGWQRWEGRREGRRERIWGG